MALHRLLLSTSIPRAPLAGGTGLRVRWSSSLIAKNVDLAEQLLPEAAVVAFENDGACLVKGAFDMSQVDALRAACERNLNQPGPLVDEHADAQGSGGRFHDDQFLYTRHAEAAEFVHRSVCGALAARAMRSHSASIFYDHLLVKEPGTVAPTPYHNDYSYWHIQGDQIVSVWVALDDVPRDVGIGYVRGSHRWRLLHPITNFSGEATDDGRYEGVVTTGNLPHVDAGVAKGELELLSWDMVPGDALLHHGFTVHGAAGNASAINRRRGYASRWCGDDIRFDPRPGTMYFNWLAAGYCCGLQPGDPMTCQLHPDVLCQRS